MMKVIIVRFGEIALKGKNRPQFEKRLSEDIKERLKINNINAKVYRKDARIYIKDFQEEDVEKIMKILFYIPGIKNYSLGYECDKELDNIKDCIIKILNNELQKIKKEKTKENTTNNRFSLYIKVRRVDKSFPKTSLEIKNEIIKLINDEFDSIELNIAAKDVLGIEIRDKAYVYFNKHKGIGGLPYGITGKGLLLLSGGMDSPVAGILSLKRGLAIDAIYFNINNKSEYEEKVIEVYKRLKLYGPKMKLYIVPYYKYHIYVYKILKDIKKQSLLRFGCLICRRGMFYIANELAKKIGAKCLITGENLGQVASQTLENLTTVTPHDLLVIRPLITYDKYEIENLAREFKIEDVINIQTRCKCLLLPSNPATKSEATKIEELEKGIKAKEFLTGLLNEIKEFS